MTLRILDLFAGIGGFSLGLESTGGFQAAAFCETNDYCQRILRQHWPETPIYGDINTLTTEQLERDGIYPDIITGGFPCQPFSLAGEQKGDADHRYLWPAMRRIIACQRPSWIVCENVYGLVGMGLDRVLFDLETEGYAARTFVVPACGVDAPHRRDRVWIMGYAAGAGLLPPSYTCLRRAPKEKGARHAQPERRGQAVAHPAGAGRYRPGGAGLSRPGAYTWEPEPDVGRVALGVPHRMDRLRALGNAVVPQVVAKIGRAILAEEAKGLGAGVPCRGSR